MGVYQKDIHLFAPYLCRMFAELAGWSWQRPILAMHKGGDSRIKIQAMKELEIFSVYKQCYIDVSKVLTKYVMLRLEGEVLSTIRVVPMFYVMSGGSLL